MSRKSQRKVAAVEASGGAGWLAAGALFLAFLVAYQPVLDAGFIWDDDSYVESNPELRHLEGLGRIWFTPGAIPQYYPLVHTTFWLEYQLWGPSPGGYHVVNLLLHATAALLLWRLLRRWALPGAGLAAALFLLHPVQVESVAWVTERKNLLSMVLALLSIHAWLRMADRDSEDRGHEDPGRSMNEARRAAGRDAPPAAPPAVRGSIGKWWTLSFLAFVAALLSKTVVATLPASLMVLSWWRSGALRWVVVRRLIPFLLVGIALGLNTARIEATDLSGTGQGAVGEAWDLGLIERVLLAGQVILFYLGKLCFPYPLAFFYHRWEVDAGALLQFVPALVVLAGLGTLYRLRARIGRGPLTAALLYCGTLFPALGFFNVWPFQFSWVADHFQYHATAVAFAAAGAGAGLLFRGPGRAAALRWGPALVVVVLGPLTALHARNFLDLETLWQDTIEKTPSCWAAHNNLGGLYWQQASQLGAQGQAEAARARLEQAEVVLRQALELRQPYPQASVHLASVLLDLGRNEESEAILREVLSSEPRNAEARVNLGVMLARSGRLQEAEAEWRQTLIDQEGHVEARVNLSQLWFQQGDLEGALEILDDALARFPRLAVLHLRRGLVLEALHQRAIAAGDARAARERSKQARVALGRALYLDPELSEARRGLDRLQRSSR